MNQNQDIIWPLLVYGGAVFLLVGVMLGLSYVLGQKHDERETHEIYESGVTVTDSAHLRFSAHFYVVAMFFVIFDLEVVFIIAWAIAFKQLGWPGYIAISVFIVILIAVLIYEWRIGALDFGASGKKILRGRKKFLSNN